MAAGTIPLSGTQRFDMYGNPLNGGALYIIAAGTVSTPQDAFADVGLTIKMPYPMSLDASGSIPFFFLDNSINAGVKIRLQDKSGVVQLASDFVLIIGPSGGTGGGGTTVDPTTLIQTGNMIMRYGVGVLTGYVRMNGLSIGSITSGATMPEGAAAGLQNLFLYLWNTDSFLQLYIGGTTPTARGASAAADWGANKSIAVPDWRGYVPGGLDDMGNSDSGILGGYFANATRLGAAGGAPSFQITDAQLPPYTPTGTVGASTAHITNHQSVGQFTSGSGLTFYGPFANQGDTPTTAPVDAPAFTGTAVPGRAQSPFGIISPRKLCTFYLKI